MKLKPLFTTDVTANAEHLIAIAYNVAKQYEGQYVKKAIKIDATTCILDIRGSVAYAIVLEQTSSIVLHPRFGSITPLPYTENSITKYVNGVIGGWKNGITPLTTPYIFPLVDSDDASYIVDKSKDTLVGEFVGDEGNYGNLYWWNYDEKEPIFLSWKGSPSRHFPLDSIVYINGFTEQETTVSGDIEDIVYYTSFSPNIYAYGNLLAEAPKWSWPRNGQDRCLVLGAMQDNAGLLWAVLQSDRYNAPLNIYIFSDGHRLETDNRNDKTTYLESHPNTTLIFEKNYTSKGGIYTGLWKYSGPIDGWSLVSEHNIGRQGLPWFGNKSGTWFINPLGYKLDTTGKLINPTSTVGTYSEPAVVCSNSRFTANYLGNAFTEFSADTVVSGAVKLSFSAASTKSATSAGTKVFRGAFDVLYDPADPQMPLTVTGGTAQIVIGQPVFINTTGGQGELTYTYTGFTVTNGIVTSAPCTLDEDGRAMGTITATDACGASVSWKVRLPGGVWMNGPTTSYGDGAFGTGNFYSRDDGATRYVEYAFGGCNTNVNTTQNWSVYNKHNFCAGNCMYWGVPITTRFCNTSHGYPRPTLPDMSVSCEAPLTSIKNCQTGGGCFDAALDVYVVCWYLTHSRTDYWVCP